MIETLGSVVRESGSRKLKMYTIEETGNTGIFEKIGFSVTSRKVANHFQGNDNKHVHIVTMGKHIA